MARALGCRKDWGLDKELVWKTACRQRGWTAGDRPGLATAAMSSTLVGPDDSTEEMVCIVEGDSWASYFRKEYCRHHEICMYCWKRGKGGHHKGVAGTRPICKFLVPLPHRVVASVVASV